MALRFYIGIAEPGSNNWSISFPAFPGVVTVGDTFSEVFAHAQDALASVIDAMQEDGEPVPSDFTATSDSPAYDPADYTDPRIVVVGVEVGSKERHVDVTMDESLLSRLDTLAQRTHATRSALLVQGARLVLATAGLD